MIAIGPIGRATAPQGLTRSLRAGATAAFSTAGRALGGWMRTIQAARMMQVLSAMSDAQLASIGLTRADIPAHARAMVYPER